MIKSTDIVIRPVQASDARQIMEWENDKSNWSVSETSSNYSLGEIIELIDSLSDIEQAKQARFIIENSTTKLPLGAIDLFSINFEKEEASIGVLVAKTDDRGKGIAQQALSNLEELCTEELGIMTLKARVHQSNLSSIRLFEKSGFSKKKLTQASQLNNADYIETLIFEKCLKI